MKKGEAGEVIDQHKDVEVAMDSGHCHVVDGEAFEGVGIMVEEGDGVESGFGAKVELTGMAAAVQLEGHVLEFGVGIVELEEAEEFLATHVGKGGVVEPNDPGEDFVGQEDVGVMQRDGSRRVMTMPSL